MINSAQSTQSNLKPAHKDLRDINKTPTLHSKFSENNLFKSPKNIRPIFYLGLILFIASAFFFTCQLQIFKKTQQESLSIYLPTPTPAVNQKANWSSYTNDNLDFILNYPGSIETTQVVEEENLIKFYNKTSEGPFKTAEFPFLQITALEKTKKEPLDWIKTESDVRILLEDNVYSNVTWQQKGNWFISSDTISTFGPELYAYQFTDQNIVKITSTLSSEYFNQILSTFKFINENQNQLANSESRCQENGGNWLADYDECENVNQKVCAELGGIFDGCASACRHNPNAEVCIEICVQVCKLSEVDKSPEGQFCGGIAAITCPHGFYCQSDENYPDAGGICVKN